MQAQQTAQNQITLDENSRHDLYQNVIALDKSHHDSVELLGLVFELLHVRIEDIEAPSHASSTQTRPAAKWALRWLLKRLSGTDQADINLRLDFRTWMLLLHLVQSLPFNVVNQLLKSHDLLTIISQVLETIRRDDRSTYVERSQLESMDIDYDQQNGSPDGGPSPHAKSRKRKRDSTGVDQVHKPSATRCFYYMVQTIHFLQQSGGSSEDASTRNWERQAILEQKPQATINILANGLDVYRRIFEITGFVNPYQAAITTNPDFCTPLFSLRDNACKAAGSSEELVSANLTLCTLPALRLLNALQSEDPTLSVHNRLDQQLRGLIAQTCVHPFRGAYIRSEHKDLRLQLQNTLKTGTEDGSTLSDFVMQIAFDCVRRENTAQRNKEDPWIRELFDTISRTPDGDIRIGSATKLLRTANDNKLQLSSKSQLELVELAVGKTLAEGEEGSPRKTGIDWHLVSSAIANNPTRLADQEDHIASITRTVLARASDLEDVSDSDTQTYDHVVSRVVLPIVQAFAISRNIETFLMLWSQYSEESGALQDDHTQNSIWTDERLLVAITSQLRETLSAARRRELVEAWTEALQVGQQEPMAAIQSLVLVDCVVASVDEDEARDLRKTDLPARLYNALWKWLDVDSRSSKASKRNQGLHRWRGWRLLYDLVDHSLLDFDHARSFEEIEGVSHGNSLMRKQLKSSAEKAIVSSKLNEAAFAWLYILRVALAIDPRCDWEEPKRILRTSWEKIASLKSSATKRTDHTARYHVMLVDPSQLALTSVMSTLEVFTSTPWIAELFTSDVLANIRHNASNQAMLFESDGDVLAWTQVWKMLDTEGEEQSSVLYKRMSELKVRAFSELSSLDESNLERFNSAVQDALTLRSSGVPKQARQTVQEVLTTWIDSGLLDDGAKATSIELSCRIAGKSFENSEYGYKNILAEEDPKMSAVRSVRDLVQNASTTNTSELRSVLMDANEVLSTSESASDFVIAAKMVSVILRAPQLQVIGQKQADELFTWISRTTSPIRKLEIGSAQSIYQCLCVLFGDILSYHRHRINGRYHLILAALSSLLWCLFEPQHAHQHPHWLNKPLSPRCAEQFARLLTSLADPSVSAARAGNKQKSTLNDPTKKARSIAGQHLSQLIISFCSFQLRGRLDPSLRAKINPGLYAILDAMSQNVMQSMSASMNAPERAIFQVLYSDWKRFGRHQA